MLTGARNGGITCTTSCSGYSVNGAQSGMIALLSRCGVECKNRVSSRERPGWPAQSACGHR